VKLNLISSRGQFGWQLQLCFFPLWVAPLFFSFSLDNKDTREMMSPSAFFSWLMRVRQRQQGGNRVATAVVVHTRVTFDGFLFAILVCHLAVSLSLLPWHSSFVFIYGHPRWPLLLSLLLMGSWADETLIFYQFQVIAGTHIIQHTVAEQRGR
jgi:hypothetical protein